MLISYNFMKKHLVCEFDHWDICLKGLIEVKGIRYYCKIAGNYWDNNMLKYEVTKVILDKECEEYLEDYKIAYKHWFPINGQRPPYNGWDLSWFDKKWKKRNPIIELAAKQNEINS